jgi:hypothetical protein
MADEEVDRSGIERNANGSEEPHSADPELWNFDGTEVDLVRKLCSSMLKQSCSVCWGGQISGTRHDDDRLPCVPQADGHKYKMGKQLWYIQDRAKDAIKVTISNHRRCNTPRTRHTSTRVP